MKYKILPSGNLQFSIDKDCAQRLMIEDIEILQDIKDTCQGDDIASLVELLEAYQWRGNGNLYDVFPDDVGALTDAPMLSNEVDFCEDGEIIVVGIVWWYPDYAVSNWLDVLIKNGNVVFTKA